MAKKNQKRGAAKRPAKPASDSAPPAAVSPAAVPAPVVGIGASAGGLEAFTGFFAAMPADSGLAFVLIPHLDPHHESLMVELMARQTRMKVVEAADGMAVEPNRIHIIPPNKYLTIAEGILRLTGPVVRAGLQTSIDLFLRSLADDQQENAICIILSGTGSHGTLGLKAIKAGGGMAMVQDPATAQHRQMPDSAAATGLADYVLPVNQMPAALLEYVKHYFTNGHARAKDFTDAPDHLVQLLTLLRARAKFDFRCYRKTMLLRRIERRMGLNHFERLSEYVAHLRTHPEEVKKLARDLLISVTSFFRDAEALQALARDVIAPLIQSKPADAPLRIWVPGCATGEEAYSIAILVLEEMARAQKTLQVQLFATDVDDAALAIARQGIYPDSITADIGEERLARFFTKADGSYQVNKQLREVVMFATQNIMGDAPFSRIDLVSCRNLLIYLEAEVQKKIITLLHFSLNEKAYLFLGPSETIGRQTELFEPVSKKWRIFRRIGPSRPERVEFPIVTDADTLSHPRLAHVAAPLRPAGFAELTQRLVLEELAPAAVLINRKHEILYFLGPTTRYLDVPTGEPTQDVIMMAREGLRIKLRSAIHRAVEENKAVHLSGIQVRRNGGMASIAVSVKPVQTAKGEDGLILLLFQDLTVAAPVAEPAREPAVVEQLESELHTTKKDLQHTIEELQSSNEELKASNEEVMSMNEELQSANEELETSKEEMQSLNEELSTVNSQLQEKIEDLVEANNDVTNLLSCSDIGIIFLDTQFHIRRFTKPARQLLNIIDSDIGRPISDITLKFIDGDLLREAEQVLHDLTPREKDVQVKERSYLRRITPYRTLDNRIEGVVITFAEVTQIKKAAEQARYLATVLKDSDDAMMILDFDGNITTWNRGAERLYGYTEAEALKLNIRKLVPAAERPYFHAVIDQLKRGERVEAWETRRICKDGRHIDVWVTTTPLTNDAGLPIAIGKIDRDITERKQAQARLEAEIERRTAALKESEARLRAILDSPQDAIITITHDGLIDSVNPATERLFGYRPAEMIGQNVKMIMPPPYSDRHDGILARYLKTGEARIIGVGREVEARRKDGSTFHVDLAVSEIKELKLFLGILRDITNRKELEREVVEIASLEQQRIGQDLHDDYGQELTALGLLGETLVNSLQDQAPKAVPLASKIVQRSKSLLRQVRNLAQGLTHSSVKAAELPAAFAELQSRLGETSGIRFTVHCDSRLPLDDGIQATHLYHIAQEACTNALKHSKAKNIAIRLESTDNAVVMSIRDDGAGIPPEAKSGLGTRIMQNRASVIGAKLAIDPVKPHGTIVVCTLPLRGGGRLA